MNNPPLPAFSTTSYQITRVPRPIAGEDILKLPDDVVIDMNLIAAASPNPYYQRSFPDASAATPYDIMFTPSGVLTGRIGGGFGKIILWVRDATQDPDQPGDQPLVVVFSKTGRIGGFPSNPDQNLYPTGAPTLFPYYYVYDPRNSGL